MSERQASFNCPQCGARYTLIRVEMSPAPEDVVECLNCGAALPSHEGRFALKYFLVGAFAGPRPKKR